MRITFKNNRRDTVNVETYLVDSGARGSGGAIKPKESWVTDDRGGAMRWVWGVEVPNAATEKDFPCSVHGNEVVIDSSSETNKCRWKAGH
jgi:hypothetical protein